LDFAGNPTVGNTHIAVVPRAPTPPWESRRSYTNLTIATVRTRHETRPGSQQQLRRVQRAASFVSSAVYHRDNSVQCKPTSERLMMWGRYPLHPYLPHTTVGVMWEAPTLLTT
jgi:hypothetical protein